MFFCFQNECRKPTFPRTLNIEKNLEWPNLRGFFQSYNQASFFQAIAAFKAFRALFFLISVLFDFSLYISFNRAT